MDFTFYLGACLAVVRGVVRKFIVNSFFLRFRLLGCEESLLGVGLVIGF